MKRVLIGCPVYERGWILPTWLSHIEQVFDAAQWWQPQFVFAYTPSSDDTHRVLDGIAYQKTILYHREGYHTTKRSWPVQKIETMVAMRNRLLDFAYETKPDVYVSLDSDVLVTSEFIKLLNWAYSNKSGAISPLVYLGPGKTTNAFYFRQGRAAHRLPPDLSLQRVSVICAAKFMGLKLLLDQKVRYEPDSRGEDFGWSKSARKYGYQLYWDPAVAFKHVMARDKLHETDARIGW